ncbi:hypothetical protein DPMN_028590 [Dreissena polymorpha]|uniref:Uncharacterized protein n=1 Tax=Dreissena polymorpha TaxID=45954 RepID=A0A9D4LV00_DREPO|nr:hypothetical protein DPMN_028590 [Dreissena polymorpha]
MPLILIASLIEISNDLLARAEISQVIWYHYDDVVDVIALWIPQDCVPWSAPRARSFAVTVVWKPKSLKYINNAGGIAVTAVVATIAVAEAVAVTYDEEENHSLAHLCGLTGTDRQAVV